MFQSSYQWTIRDFEACYNFAMVCKKLAINESNLKKKKILVSRGIEHCELALDFNPNFPQAEDLKKELKRMRETSNFLIITFLALPILFLIIIIPIFYRRLMHESKKNRIYYNNWKFLHDNLAKISKESNNKSKLNYLKSILNNFILLEKERKNLFELENDINMLFSNKLKGSFATNELEKFEKDCKILDPPSPHAKVTLEVEVTKSKFASEFSKLMIKLLDVEKNPEHKIKISTDKKGKREVIISIEGCYKTINNSLELSKLEEYKSVRYLSNIVNGEVILKQNKDDYFNLIIRLPDSRYKSKLSTLRSNSRILKKLAKSRIIIRLLKSKLVEKLFYSKLTISIIKWFKFLVLLKPYYGIGDKNAE